MNTALGKYKDPEIIGTSAMRVSLRDKLTQEQAHIEARLKQIKRALELLDKNPDTEELINLL